MTEEDVISVRCVEKSFKCYTDKGKWLKDYFATRGRRKYELHQVLKGISFDVKKGEAVGLIGRNGCGKSTTLKLLSKIIRPDRGTIEIKGRVSSLLELGAGFHPDLSGRKNIYMNASIFGLSKKEIDMTIENIIEFSELENFIDNPIRTYSSGMYMRLAFSVAINVEADILLIDEILAVGDVSFQKKCFDKLRDIKASGTTIIIVSHSLEQIESVCDRSIWLENGKIIASGMPEEVHRKYLSSMEKERFAKVGKKNEFSDKNPHEAVESAKIENAEIWNSAKSVTNLIKSGRKYQEEGKLESRIRFQHINFINSGKKQDFLIKNGESFWICMTCEQENVIEKAYFCFKMFDEHMICRGETKVLLEGQKLKMNKNKVLLAVRQAMLPPGKYSIELGIYDITYKAADILSNVINFMIQDNDMEVNTDRMDFEWIVG